MNQKITKNFYWSEFYKSYTATRYHINNIPTDDKIKNNIKLLTENILQPVRDKFGSINITSGYRCQILNKKLGSSNTSWHVKGCAADIEPKNTIKMINVIEWIYNNCEFQELIAEFFPDGWIHAAFVEGLNKKRLKLKDKNHNYSIVTIEYLKKLYQI